MKILITGANGQLGYELTNRLKNVGEVNSFTRESFDLENAGSIRDAISSVKPDVILNPAAYTAVDLAESEQEKAYLANRDAPKIIAEEAAKCGALLIHYSTDYVFDGSKGTPYIESDKTNPKSVYGASKLAGEEVIAASGASSIILRTSWLYASRGKNFLLTMARLMREKEELSIVNDQIGSPTSVNMVAEATAKILDDFDYAKENRGLYHLTCGGNTSWFGFAEAIKDEILQKEPNTNLAKLSPIPTSDYPTPAKRPLYSVLDCTKFLDTFNFDVLSWGKSLGVVMSKLSI